jgi:hypothetical protein
MRYFWALMAYVSAIVVAVASCGGGGTGNGDTNGQSSGTNGNGGQSQSTGSAGHAGGAGGASGGTGGSSGALVLAGSGGSDGGPTMHCPTYKSCADQSAACGTVSDGCNNVENCGGCATNQTCTANQCVTSCTPQTCTQQGFNCGSTTDGCNTVLDCGTCPGTEVCGANNMANVCGQGGCVAGTCASLNFNCGMQGDTCGGILDCGTCTGTDTCGGGGTSGVCGTPTCVVTTTCATLGFNCGMTVDNCSNIIDCGTCPAGETCGTGQVCTSGGVTCTNLCLQQTTCPGTATTSISGTVYAPNGTDPLYDVLVYVPNAAVQPFPAGVSCDPCGADASGSPLVQATTGVDGTFTITNMPVGNNIPLVIQLGRWRRQIVIPKVSACANTAVAKTLTVMPQNHTQGDIPLMAFVTGNVDALECVFRKIGIQDTEFGNPGSTSRLQLFSGAGGPGANYNASTPSEATLWGTQAEINKYDMVLFACEGDEYDQAVASQDIVINYANAGGRIFATHYSYVWLFNDAPFSGTANWDADQPDSFDNDPGTGMINTTFPKGVALAQWLQIVGASTTYGQIPIGTLRHDFDGVIAPSQLWISLSDPGVNKGKPVPMHYTFNTPTTAQPANQCGRVVYDDFHVEDQDLLVEPPFFPAPDFPSECAGGAMTPQEKLLEFMLFDLASCVTPDVPTCTPTTCMASNTTCGPIGDGCGNILQCGMCPSGQACIEGVCSTGCTPKTCASEGFTCGMQGDGCGNAINCGACPSGTCGGGGTPGMCGNGSCSPKTCATLDLMCGSAGDGCGNILGCGTCPAGETCGANNMPGICGKPPCMSKTCAGLGYTCGSASDGCGNILSCGTCQAPQTCGGGGKAYTCGGGSGS